MKQMCAKRMELLGHSFGSHCSAHLCIVLTARQHGAASRGASGRWDQDLKHHRSTRTCTARIAVTPEALPSHLHVGNTDGSLIPN